MYIMAVCMRVCKHRKQERNPWFTNQLTATYDGVPCVELITSSDVDGRSYHQAGLLQASTACLGFSVPFGHRDF